MVVVGVDPGGTTGLYALRANWFGQGEEATSYLQIEEFIRHHNPKYVVMEDFYVGPGPVDVKSPLKVIGMVEYLCSILKIPLTLQSPSILQGCSAIMHSKGSRHIASAQAHATYFLRRHDAILKAPGVTDAPRRSR